MIKKHFPLVFLMLIQFVLLAQDVPEVQWYFDTHDAAFGQSAAADIDNDGKLEVVFGCYRNDSMVYALNAEDGSLLWKYNTHPLGYEGCNDVASIIFDVNDDDTLDVIVPSSCNPKSFCFHGASGKVLWTADTRGSDSPPTIADIDDDGEMEVLHGEFGGYVICLNAATGKKEWEIPVDLNSWIQTAPTIVDIDKDGQLDFVVATWNKVSGDTNKLYAYRGHDQKLLWAYPLGDVAYHGTAVADLDKDGKPELVIGDYSGTLSVINSEDGSLFWEYKCPNYFYIGSPATIADLDGDDNCEIVFSAWYKIFALTFEGKLKWEYNIPGNGHSFRGSALSDLDSDGLPDVVFGTSKGDVIALKGNNATVLWKMALDSTYGDTLEFDHAPLIADFDNDGTKDVFIVGGFTKYPDFQKNYGRAYMISAGEGTGPDWLMFQYDNYRGSSFCGASVGLKEPVNRNSTEIRVYPNPSQFVTNIEYELKHRADISIKLYDLMGKELIILVDGTQQQGKYQYQFSAKDKGCPGGLYLLLITIDGNNVMKRMIGVM